MVSNVVKKVFKKNIAYRVRIADGHNFLIGNDAYHEINSSGEEIWELIDGKVSVGDIVKQLTKSYAIDSEIVSQDVYEFLQGMQDIDAIKEIKYLISEDDYIKLASLQLDCRIMNIREMCFVA
jgi:hypothetical protein